MSEGIIIAVIGFVGTVIGAVIGAFTDIQVAKIANPKSKSKLRQGRSSNRKIVIIAITASLGLMCSVVFAITQLSSPTQALTQATTINAIDLGSGWKVSDRRETEKGKEIVYAHFPVGKIQYTNINSDDSLTKVYKVCRFSRTNIFNEFIPKGGNSEMADYESNVIEISNDCHIEFTVRDLIGGEIGIEMEAKPTP